MSDGLVTALISGVVALAVATVGGLATWLGIRRERKKWLVDIKVAWTLDLLRARLVRQPHFET